MDLKELLQHFNNGDTVGEDWEVIELMRYYSRQAQKISEEQGRLARRSTAEYAVSLSRKKIIPNAHIINGSI